MQALTISIFLVILGGTLAITYWSSRKTKTVGDFYTAGGISPAQNGFALAGDWMSAAAFLGFTGLSALYSMDGAMYAVAALVAFLVILMLVAEPFRNVGKYTLADVIAYRLKRPQARLAAILGTVVVNIAYLIPQMVGAGALAKLLLNIPYNVSIIFAGVAMVIYVMFGGMLATTWIQIIKAVLLLTSAIVLIFLILVAFNFNPATLFSGVEAKYGADALSPGQYLTNPLDQIALGVSFVFGTAGLPHIMIRFFTVRDSVSARRSVIWVMFLAGGFFLATSIIGLAAAYFVGRDHIMAADKGGNLALPLLAQFLGGGEGSFGGQAFLAFVSAVAFATILAVVAGLTISTSGAIANDLYVKVIHRGNVDEKTHLRVARLSTIGVAATAIGLSLLVSGQNVAVLVILAIAVAASANFPVIVLSLFWRRFNTAGVITGLAVGLISAVGLALAGPAFMGKDALFPLVNPTLVSLPLAMIAAVIATLVSPRNHESEADFDEVLVRGATGAPAEL